VAPSPSAEQHLTPDLLAAGDADRSAAENQHLSTCPECRLEAAAFRSVADALAEPTELAELPDGLWERIEGALAEETPETEDTGSDVGRARDRRRVWPLAAAAAVVGVVVGAGALGLYGALVGTSPGDPGDGPAPAPPVAVGSAVLEPVAAADVSGQAEMTQAPDGRLQLRVELTEVPSGGYREVWLRDAEASRLISLGTMSATSAELPVPDGVDLDRFPVVDVSQEDFDGDPSHSGTTLAAGAMETADA
jgi:hypothetical protein